MASIRSSLRCSPGRSQIVSAKLHAVEACWRIVDLAMEVSGGAGMFRGNDLERMFRDAGCGRFPPANTFLTHEIVGSFAIMQPGTSHFAWTAEETVAQVHSVGPWGMTYVRRPAQEIARAQTLVAGDRQPRPLVRCQS